MFKDFVHRSRYWAVELRTLDRLEGTDFFVFATILKQKQETFQIFFCQTCLNDHLWTTTPCQQRPAWSNNWSFSDSPLHNKHVFQVPKVLVVHRFDCILFWNYNLQNNIFLFHLNFYKTCNHTFEAKSLLMFVTHLSLLFLSCNFCKSNFYCIYSLTTYGRRQS
jgi:hypothetical protein